MKKALVTLFTILSFQAFSSADMVSLTSPESTFISNFGVGASDMNFNGQRLLVDEGSGTTRSLIGFSGLFGGGVGQVPLGSTVTQALLSVKTTSAIGAESADTISVHQVITAWDQTNVTWNSFNSGGAAGTDFLATAETTFNPMAPNTVYDTIDITNIVQNWSNGTANNGVILISDGTDGLFLHDNTAIGMGPAIAVNFTAIPEPTAFVMMGLVGIGFGCCRWWKSRKTQ